MTKARVWAGAMVAGVIALGGIVAGRQAGTAKTPGNIWPPAMKGQAKATPLSPQDEVKTFSMPPGFHIELVASEPMIESPILIDFDADGRLYVLEQLTFLPDMSGRDSNEAINRVSVLEDTNGDGVMDKKTVFADKLHMPRALKVLKDGVLIGEPPNLWFMKDTNGDLVADTKELVVNTYGNPNGGIEHNANSLFWAMDNIMYSSEHTFDLREKNGKFESLPTLSRGQWQISQDDAGRVYRNVNDSPIFVDYTPARYFLRNPNAARTRGLYELLIEQDDAITYPVRDTRGVNRGYRDPYFRADGSSIVIQGAGTPTIYRGNKYPANLRGAGFITDSPTNLVHAMNIVNTNGKLSAKNVYPRGEILASSDERFRPVSLFDGPDGNMYVVDMYRGVVQAGGIWSEYLTDYIKTHDMQMPVGRGRIWRIVYGTGATARGPKPSLSAATPAQLVQALSNPIGWWRDTAQRLLVERGDKSVAPALKTLAATAPDWRTKLHALWTLDGLDAIEPADVTKALADLNPDVRANAVRLSERWLGQPGETVSAAVLKLAADPNWNVRRQVGASLGELPAPARVDPAVALLTRDGADGIIVDAVLSSLKGVEGDVMARVLQARAPAVNPPSDAVMMLAAAMVKAGDVARVQQLLAVATTTTEPMWRRTAVLQGLDAALPAGAGGGGRGGGRGGGGVSTPGLSAGPRVSITPAQRTITLPAEPAGLISIAAGTTDFAYLAGTVAGKLDWPGRPAPVVRVTPLTPEEQKRYAAGEQIFKNVCAACHGEDGRGKDKLGGNLLESKWVNGTDIQTLIRIVQNGKEGAIGLMPPLGSKGNIVDDDEKIASVLTYVRRAWGHTGSPLTPLAVMETRSLNKRDKPWTDAELDAPPAGRGGNRGAGGGNRGGGAPGGAGAGAPAGNAPARGQ